MPTLEVARLVLGYLSDHGLEQTKSAFYKECPDLKTNYLIDLTNQGQKLSLIVEEYFVLKGYQDKQLKRDPEAVLQLLWKQFDTLVGQLKHSTIHAVKEAKASKIQPMKQTVRVRELNRQNRASLQRRKAKSVFVPNPDLVHVKPVYNEVSNEGLVPSYTFTTSAIGALGKCDSRSANNTQSLPPSSICTSKVNFQPVTKTGVLLRNKCTENGQVVVNFNPSSVSTSSPKRKSVQPKKRPVVMEVTSIIPPSQCSAAPSATLSSDEPLDLASLVAKIIDQPEFSEKLAEKINYAVEIDTVTTQDEVSNKTQKVPNAATSAAVVDSDKIDNIMEMMKTDPAFEQLFSSFETFNSSIEESDCDRNQDVEPSDVANQKQPISPSDNCAMDALLLLANSPGISSIVYPTGSPPVLMSPGKPKSPSSRAAQPIFSHVRQLDFSSIGACSGATSPGGKSSAEGNTLYAGTMVDIKVVSEPHGTMVDTKVVSEPGTMVDTKVISEPSRVSVPEVKRGNIVGYKNISQCSQADSSDDSRKAEGERKKYEENSLSVLEELATNAFILCDGDAGESECGMKKDYLPDNTVDFTENDEDIEGPGGGIKENEGDINGHRRDSERHEENIKECERDTKGYGRDLKEDTVGNKDKEKDSNCVTINDVIINQDSSVHDSVEKDCGTSMDNEGHEGRKDIEIKTEPPLDNIPEDSKEYMGKKSVREEPGEVLFCTLNQRTPVSSAADSEKVLKRKLKKAKKSIGGSKKRKTLPLDLDVDKFLSRLHYVGETT